MRFKLLVGQLKNFLEMWRRPHAKLFADYRKPNMIRVCPYVRQKESKIRPTDLDRTLCLGDNWFRDLLLLDAQCMNESIKFNENPFGRSGLVTCIQADWRSNFNRLSPSDMNGSLKKQHCKFTQKLPDLLSGVCKVWNESSFLHTKNNQCNSHGNQILHRNQNYESS